MQKNPHALKVKLILWLIAALTMLSGTTIAASLPGISAHFVPVGGDNEIISRLILTIPALTIAIVAPLAGWVIHHFGKIKPIYFSLVLYAVAGCSGLFADSIVALLIGRVGLGVAVAVLMTAGTTLVGDYYEGVERDRFISKQSAFVTLGGVFFLVGGGLLADFSWRAPFGVYFVSLLFIPLTAIALFEPTKSRADPNQNASLFGKGGYFDALPAFAVAFFTMAIFYIVPTQLPFVVESMNGDGIDAGIVMGIGPLFAAISALSYANLRKRFSLKEIYLAICLLQGAGLGIVGLASEVWQLYAPFVLVGLGNGLAMGNTSAWFLELAAPQKRAKLSGILTGSFFLGQFCSPLFVHPFLRFMQLHYVFSLFGGFLLIAAFVLALNCVKAKLRYATAQKLGGG
ncbi:MAG: MFS transporter [Helicobacteraceae bacterium]|jgi:MFS family permease|nr:MFS transporter [Helicobacteraceae bacterium]